MLVQDDEGLAVVAEDNEVSLAEEKIGNHFYNTYSERELGN